MNRPEQPTAYRFFRSIGLRPLLDNPLKDAHPFPSMHRFCSFVLVLAFLALGSGLAEFLHNAEHAREDARAAAAASAGPSDSPDSHSHDGPLHDESNCRVHAMLHAPLLSAGWVPLLVLLGLFVAFLNLLTPAPVFRKLAVRLPCRGPPTCWC